MYAIIRVGSSVAILEDWIWMSDDDVLLGLLNGMLDPDGSSPSDPQPHITEARRAVKELGGEMIEEQEIEHGAGLTY